MATVQEEVEHGSVHEINRPTNNIAIVLILITVVEIGLGMFLGPTLGDQISLRQFMYTILVMMAITKAFLVVSYFMGLNYEKHKYPIAILLILVPLLFVFLFIVLPITSITSYATVNPGT